MNDDDDDDDESKAIAVFKVSRHPQLRGPQSLQWPQKKWIFSNILKNFWRYKSAVLLRWSTTENLWRSRKVTRHSTDILVK